VFLLGQPSWAARNQAYTPRIWPGNSVPFLCCVEIVRPFAGASDKVVQLMVALTKTDDFRYRRASGRGPGCLRWTREGNGPDPFTP